jgi:hypothetical protein
VSRQDSAFRQRAAQLVNPLLTNLGARQMHLFARSQAPQLAKVSVTSGRSIKVNEDDFVRKEPSEEPGD